MKKLFRRKTLQAILERPEEEHSLHKNLGVWDLTAFGIAAVIGAGIFGTIGTAAVHGGPAVSLLFVFTAVACGFSALCYAEFASRIPIAGSAYTYAYASFGELIAWIIGWDLIIEYCIGNIAVAIPWSDYFTNLMAGLGWKIPAWCSMDYLSASRAQAAIETLLREGKALTPSLIEARDAWQTAPQWGGLRFIADVPAFSIVVLITILVYVGIRESKRANNLLVILKLVIIVLVIAVGAFYVSPENWNPFAPNGISGVLKGVAGVFFAFIGFDAISTTAEECKEPQRDLPKAMIISLLVCTVLYVLIALTLTGMVPYQELGVGDPLAYVFERVGLNWMNGLVSVSAVVAMASVLLVFQMGQPRIWMSMSRDGLLPAKFSQIHPKFKTPAFATVVTGILVAVPALFMNLTEVTELSSIGTLFAFALVCGGVLLLKRDKSLPKARFQVPYVSGRYWFPIILISFIAIGLHENNHLLNEYFLHGSVEHPIGSRIPHWFFGAFCVMLLVGCIRWRWSLIPVLGLFFDLFLICELEWTNWLRFGLWLLAGLVIYAFYGFKRSKLAFSNVKK